MRISEVAKRSGLSAKTIRYYEEIGLIEPATRGVNGYRDYDLGALGQLRFLARARDVGFNLEESRQLLGLLKDSSRQSVHARSLVLEKSQQLEQKIQKLHAMQDVLNDMARRCNGDEGPECAILDELAGLEGAFS
ncbi:MAG: MerR family DNA-binding transcriptional regulator [Halioglobus sp.]